MGHSSRLGTFFLLVGLLLLLLFVMSVLSKDMQVLFLLASFVCLSIAYIARPRRESQEGARFGTIRRLSQRSRERREENKNKKAKK
jgi:hypothetical protein